MIIFNWTSTAARLVDVHTAVEAGDLDGYFHGFKKWKAASPITTKVGSLINVQYVFGRMNNHRNIRQNHLMSAWCCRFILFVWTKQNTSRSNEGLCGCRLPDWLLFHLAQLKAVPKIAIPMTDPWYWYLPAWMVSFVGKMYVDMTCILWECEPYVPIIKLVSRGFARNQRRATLKLHEVWSVPWNQRGSRYL